MTTLSKEEYLKRYLSPQENNEKPKKKKKKKAEAVKKSKGFKIVDDDVSWKTITPKQDEYDEINDKLLAQDEKPQVETIDVRTEEEKKLDEYRKSNMWKALDSKDGRKKQSDISRTKKSSRRRKRVSSDSDLDSVPRGKNRDFDDIPRDNKSRVAYHDSDSDLDVTRPMERSRNTGGSDSDLDVVPRRTKSKRKDDSDSDMDFPRSRSSRNIHRDSDSDLDIQRSKTNKPTKSQQTNMEGGGRGGLTSVDLLRMEMKKLEKKESAMKVMAEEYKNVATVYRERGSGKKRDLAKEKEETEEDVRRRKLKEERYAKWGGGLKQAEMRADAIADTIHESNKSLTRYNDDADLEAMRKAEYRGSEDTMGAYIMKKKRKEKGIVNERPKYNGPAPAPNRFRIMPGYRWDGVDRSNGFEKRYFQTISDNQALKDEFYKWSVGDM